MQIVYEPNSLCHYGVKGMKWGYTDGSRNGNRTANVNNYVDYPAEDDVPASVKKDRTDTRTIKIERTASGSIEYGNYGPSLNTLSFDKKTGKKSYANTVPGEKVVSKYLEKKQEKEVKHGEYLEHHGVPGMKWGRRKARYEKKLDRYIQNKDRFNRKQSAASYKAAKLNKTISKTKYKQAKGKEINERSLRKKEARLARAMKSSYKYEVKSRKYEKKIEKAKKKINKYGAKQMSAISKAA